MGRTTVGVLGKRYTIPVLDSEKGRLLMNINRIVLSVSI